MKSVKQNSNSPPKERIVGKEVDKEIAEMVSLNANRKKIQYSYMRRRQAKQFNERHS